MKAPLGFDIWTQTFDPATMASYGKLDPMDALEANTAGVTITAVAGTAITSTRTSATRMTRDSGVWIHRVYIDISSVVGTYAVGETVTETTSTSTGVIEEVSSVRMVLKTISKAFTGAKTLTGGTSGATSTGGTATNVTTNLVGLPVYSYVNGVIGTGAWSLIVANTTTYVDVALNDLTTSADRIIIANNAVHARESMSIDYGA